MTSPENKIRCVLFDAVGTLIYPCPPVSAAYGAVARRHGSSLSEFEIGERFREAFLRQEAIDAGVNGLRTDEERELRRWRAIVAETLCDLRDSTGAFEELWQHFLLVASWRLFDDVCAVWQVLEERGYRLGIASNFDGRLWHICHSLPPLDRCPDVFVSSELGVRKPAVEFFRRVEERLQLTGEEILLVGDDWNNDYLAARNAGWHALFLDRRGERELSAWCVCSLRALIDAELLGVR